MLVLQYSAMAVIALRAYCGEVKGKGEADRQSDATWNREHGDRGHCTEQRRAGGNEQPATGSPNPPFPPSQLALSGRSCQRTPVEQRTGRSA